MRRLFLSLILVFSLGISTIDAQTNSVNVSDLFGEFKKCEHADYVHIPKLLIKLASVFAKDEDESDRKVIRAVSSVRILDLSDCSSDVKLSFADKLNRLKTSGYEKLIQQKSKDEQSLILTKMKKNCIRELVIVSSDGDDCTLLLIKGKIRPKDVHALINDKNSLFSKK